MTNRFRGILVVGNCAVLLQQQATPWMVSGSVRCLVWSCRDSNAVMVVITGAWWRVVSSYLQPLKQAEIVSINSASPAPIAET